MSGSEDSISVVIPTHQRADLLLGRALPSVLAQSRAPSEVIVVDDGSTDGTAGRVAAAHPPGSSPPVRLLRLEKRRGPSAARNLGIAAARGEWIAFLDSDDEWRPLKLERQLAALARQPQARICHSDETWIRGGRRVNPRRRHAKAGGWIFRRCLPLCVISPSAVVIHRSVFDDVGLFDEELPACEDYDLWLRITPRFPVLFVAEPLVVKHGGHPDQLSRTVPALDRYRIRALEKALADPALSAGDRAAVRSALLAKLDVYLAGARKRGREPEVARCKALRARLEGGSATGDGGR